MRLELTFDVERIYTGRLSVYLSLKINRRAWFLSRWDTVRVHPKPWQITLWRGPVMTWYVGMWTIGKGGEHAA